MKRSPCTNGILLFHLGAYESATRDGVVPYFSNTFLQSAATILAIVTAIPFSSFRALLSCGLVCCILSSGFTFNEVQIKSVIVLLYASHSYQQRHYELLFIILATLD